MNNRLKRRVEKDKTLREFVSKLESEEGVEARLKGIALIGWCCWKPMEVLKTYRRKETPKGTIKKEETGYTYYYCSRCGTLLENYIGY